MNTIPALAGALALLLSPQIAAKKNLHAEAKSHLRTYIVTMREKTWEAQDRAGERRWPTRYLERHGSERYLNHLARMWRHRLKAVPSLPALPPHYSAWMCIHRYEGSWTDGGAPYWGGLQMDLAFQRAYAPSLLERKGTADHWTPLEQMWVAENAYSSGRGFSPWPNTARYCGLL